MSIPERMSHGNLNRTIRQLKRVLLLCGAVCLWFFLPVSAFALDRYVATNGVNSGSATNPASPWQTIRYAVTNAAANDYIHVVAGTYTESNIAVSVSGLIIEGAGKAQTIVQAATSRGVATTRVFLLNTNCTLRGMTVRYGRFTANNFGAGIAIATNGTFDVTLDQCKISENDPRGAGTTPNLGGALALPGTNVAGQVYLLNCDILNNTGSSGGQGGIVSESRSLTISNCVISGNSAPGNGGGVYMKSGTLAIHSSTIVSNVTGTAGYGYGGGAYTEGALTIEQCLFAFNTAQLGAGLYLNLPNNSTGTVISSTIYANTTGSNGNAYGGGIYLENSVSGGTNLVYALYNSTVANNYAGNNAGGIQNASASQSKLLLYSSLVASNTITTNGTPSDINIPSNVGGTIPLCTNSFISVNASATSPVPAGQPNTSGSYVGTSAAPLDPKLLPLANNGGLTWTCALATNSQAIDHGLNSLSLAYDQRGAPYPRVYSVTTNRPDIGAYEYSILVPPAPKGSFLMVH